MAKIKARTKAKATQKPKHTATANIVPISAARRGKAAAGDDLHQSLLLLDRLEELREELVELGLTSLADIDARIAELEAIVGDEPDDDDSDHEWGDADAHTDDDEDR